MHLQTTFALMALMLILLDNDLVANEATYNNLYKIKDVLYRIPTILIHC